MAFRKCQRSCKTEPGWRLATVDEVRKRLDSVKRENLFNEFERARLLDGWIGGSTDELQPKVGFRSCLGYMLLLQCPTPDVSGSGDMVMDRYSDVDLNEEGKEAALFLCCEDWNYEVVNWLLNSWSKDKNQKFGSKGIAGNLSRMVLETSEKVSKMAMTFHSLRPGARVPKNDFNRSSMKSMVHDIFKFLRERIGFLKESHWEFWASEYGGEDWDELGLTMDLARFHDSFGFNINEDWDEIANIVWYVVADAFAVATVRSFVIQNPLIDQLGSTSQKMGDLALVVSIMAHANQLVNKTFFDPDTLWKVVEKTAKAAGGNCKQFKKLILTEGYKTISGNYGFQFLNSVLLDAVRRGDADLVKRLSESGLCLVDEEGNKGKTPLDLAVEWQRENVRMVAALLSQSSKAEDYFGKLDTASYLREFCRNGNLTLVEKLLKSAADPLEKDSEGRTALHYAVEGQNEESAQQIIDAILSNGEQVRNADQLLTASDMYGRNALHIAAFVGHVNICLRLLTLENEALKSDTKDSDDQSAVYYAVAGHHDNEEVLDVLIGEGASVEGKESSSGTTPLHIASERGNEKMVARLLSRSLFGHPEKRQKYVRAADVLGQTALHKAASGGHINVVRILLEKGAHPLEERDCDGKTALHHAVQAEDEEDAMEIVKLLLNKCDKHDEKALLLFASAVGIGCAEESLESKPQLKRLIIEQRKEMEKRNNNLVRLASDAGNIEMTRELLTRGARIDDIQKDEVRKQIANMVERGTDKPTLLDNLGRRAFADGLAALFLNPFVKSPITVGISGEWGMGKSSLMIQTESILLKTAAQLAFTDVLQADDFPGSRKSKPSEIKNVKLRQSIESMLASKGNVKMEDFLTNYRAEFHEILKSLAVMDHRDTFEIEKEESSREDIKSDGKMQVQIPSILTVRYNAWNYRNESQAWAGLAVGITKELESTMTVAQRLRTSWRYTWANSRGVVCVNVILPCCFAIILAVLATVILWLLLDRFEDANVKDLKYGSFVLTLIALVWAVVKSVMSVVKPISSQMFDYMSLPDHSQKLGYHHKVTNDIKFLKDEIGHKPFWLWKFLACIWSCTLCSCNDNYIPGTTIPKTTPASNRRMIVFVDDLDRCQENVVLQILSAVNLVLAACEVNVVLGMDKSMIQRAIIKMHGDESNLPNKTSQDMADNYLSKIFQLPLDLPDPSDSESLSFLEDQLGLPATRKEASESAADTHLQNVDATRKLNPKFRIGTSTPRNSKIAREDISNTEQQEEAQQQEETPAESRDIQQDTKITISSPENQCTGDPIQKTSPSDAKQSNPSPITREMLLPKYSEGEREAFYFLRTQATRSRKLPREWKRFLNYHRLAWNILFKRGEVKAVEGWQVQLIAWVFVCWQWKDPIDTLILEWDELPVLRKWNTVKDALREREQNSGPSLRDIVEHHIVEKQKKTEAAETKGDFTNQPLAGEGKKAALKVENPTSEEVLEEKTEAKEQREDLVKGKGVVNGEEGEKAEECVEQDRPMKTINEKKLYEKAEGKGKGKEDDGLEEWKRLKQILRKYNVSMDGIQAFQKFRFYCVPGHLHWPLRESNSL